ncbi:MAG TPA: transketolase [Steroidobacteraceae bacterium]|jgi:transketolase|nr:transketolase [Steroidobacteraceae bacterium]
MDTPASTPTRRALANAIRALSMDAVQAANSGHPGAPMGMADIAEVLWRDFLKHSPANPRWFNRDRFVLSNGHGSMLLYSLLHLTGYPVTLDELKNFRQLGARTAGHPERDLDMGIETTTGPLGQGLANAVGFALAEKLLAAEFNKDGLPIVDHFTYCFAGDGCLMEGISHEACSLAGTLKLGKLIVFYDDNGISIDGKVQDWFTDDTPKRFESYGWHVVKNVDGHDSEAVTAAIKKARARKDQPSLICCKTIIGWGAPNKQGTKSVHGEALGAEEVANARKTLGWEWPAFVVPDDIRAAWDHREAGTAAEKKWNRIFKRYKKEHPEAGAEFERRMKGELPADWAEIVQSVLAAGAAVTGAQATRASSQVALNVLGPKLPEMLGGSADLTGSVNTLRKDSKPITIANPIGNYVYYGVREFGMTAIMNGLALHGGYRPYGGTFLVFSDYARNAVRVAAIMHCPTTLVYTHDSIGLGEDGPTHQPVEHLASLRAMPNLHVWRGCDAVESGYSWVAALERKNGPTALVFTRQGLPQQARTPEQLVAMRKGGYVLIDCNGPPEAIVIATGSEVGVAAPAVKELQAAGKRVRLVSMPCCEVFDAQPAPYRESVLPSSVMRRVAVEAGATQSWWRYVGSGGRVLGIDQFGASGKGPDLFKHFGITSEAVKALVEQLLS